MWNEDQKDGKGTYFYVAKQQRMDGEWLQDMCKYGTLLNFRSEREGEWERGRGRGEEREGEGGKEREVGSGEGEGVSGIPALSLIDPGKVLEEQEEMVRRMREMRTGRGGQEEGEDNDEDAEVGADEGEKEEGQDEGQDE